MTRQRRAAKRQNEITFPTLAQRRYWQTELDGGVRLRQTQILGNVDHLAAAVGARGTRVVVVVTRVVGKGLVVLVFFFGVPVRVVPDGNVRETKET